MARLRVHSFTISLDGYGAGPNQTRETPLGVGGEELHDWLVATRMFHAMQRREGGTTGLDDEIAIRGFEGIGAWIMGRNMFGPVRGPWPDDTWRGWWGRNPPYHAPTFVLTHHPRSDQPMEGGTVFHFVTEGIDVALEHARRAAGDKDIRLLGGVSTIRQYLQARLVDEMHLAVAPRLLGSGESMFAGLDLLSLGYSVTKHMASEAATHYVIEKAG
jgi:dihydrofolate reductase